MSYHYHKTQSEIDAAMTQEKGDMLKIRMVSRACEAGDCDSCRHPKCECDCHEKGRGAT